MTRSRARLALAWLSLPLASCSLTLDFEQFGVEGDGGAPPADGSAGLDAVVGVDAGQRDGSAPPDAPVTDGAGVDAPLTCGRCDCDDTCEAGVCTPRLPVDVFDVGRSHVCAIANERLFCWGDNGNGQLGLGDRTLRTFPTEVGAYVELGLGDRHTCAIDTSGTLSCWGANDTSQLGSAPGERLAPTRVTVASGAFGRVTGGGFHTCASRPLTAMADDVCFGLNTNYQLTGISGTFRTLTASRYQLAAGGAFTLGIAIEPMMTRALFSWGLNSDGQLGIGSVTRQQNPVEVAPHGDWETISAGDRHACGIRLGFLWCWGANDAGQAAPPPSSDPLTTPVRLGGDLDWRDVAAGVRHTCGVRADGHAFCFGSNAQGALGNGTDGGSPALAQVASDERFAHVRAGDQLTCATTNVGALFCWGANGMGQVGISTTDGPVTSPRRVCLR